MLTVKSLRNKILAAGLIGWMFSTCAVAALKWDHLAVESVAKVDDTQTEAVFPFKNTGDTVVTIQEIKPSCGCTTYTLEKKTYQPGESGQIKAVLNANGLVGPQEKVLRVTTDADKEPILLFLRTNIPALVTIAPRVVIWAKGAELGEKIVTVSLAPGANISLSGIHSDENDIVVSLEKTKDANRYLVHMKPSSVTGAYRAKVQFQVNRPGAAAYIMIGIFAYVQ